jgi:hypothetical protein
VYTEIMVSSFPRGGMALCIGGSLCLCVIMTYLHSLRATTVDPHRPCFVHNVVTPEEAAAIIQEATAKGMQRSTVLSQDRPVQGSRTSRHVFLAPETSPAAAAIMQRA